MIGRTEGRHPPAGSTAAIGLRKPVQVDCRPNAAIAPYHDLVAIAGLSYDAVLAAIKEFDELGRHRFLTVYGYGKATKFALVHDGKLYDPKAIVGVAHRYSPLGRPLANSELSGGTDHANPALERLGFTVIKGAIQSCTRRGCLGRAEWLADTLVCDSCLGDHSGEPHDQEILEAFRSIQEVTTVDLEVTTTPSYAIPASPELLGYRRESLLCARYVAFFGRDLKRKRIKIKGETNYLYTDAYDQEEHELYESKASAERPSVRMGFGQLRDYRRHIERETPGRSAQIGGPALASSHSPTARILPLGGSTSAIVANRFHALSRTSGLRAHAEGGTRTSGQCGTSEEHRFGSQPPTLFDQLICLLYERHAGVVLECDKVAFAIRVAAVGNGHRHRTTNHHDQSLGHVRRTKRLLTDL